MLCSIYGRRSARPIQDKDTKFADSWKAGQPACGNKLQQHEMNYSTETYQCGLQDKYKPMSYPILCAEYHFER